MHIGDMSPLEYEIMLDAWRAWRLKCFKRYGHHAIDAFFDLRDERVKVTV